MGLFIADNNFLKNQILGKPTFPNSIALANARRKHVILLRDQRSQKQVPACCDNSKDDYWQCAVVREGQTLQLTGKIYGIDRYGGSGLGILGQHTLPINLGLQILHEQTAQLLGELSR